MNVEGLVLRLNCWYCLDPKYFTGKVVPPVTPTTTCGLYWGYTVRLAQSFGAVFTESPYKVNCKYRFSFVVSKVAWSTKNWCLLVTVATCKHDTKLIMCKINVKLLFGCLWNENDLKSLSLWRETGWFTMAHLTH